jgi:beta-barrel assembly-enhancing protease
MLLGQRTSSVDERSFCRHHRMPILSAQQVSLNYRRLRYAASNEVHAATEALGMESVMVSQSNGQSSHRENRSAVLHRILTAMVPVMMLLVSLSIVSPAQEEAPAVPETAKIKSGSIDDVNAIGTRNIGGRGIGNWYSIESEVKMGRQFAAQVDRSVKFVTDPVVTEYVNRIAQNLVRNSDAKVPFTVKVIDADDVNAFALPGGFFYVNSGLILAADSESELAGVMAHEISHVIAHHAARQMTRQQYAQFGTIPLIFIGGPVAYGAYEAASVGIPLTFMKFSRGFEAQADYLGVQYLYKAGYDPESFIAFFEKIEAMEKHKPGTIARAFEDHPPTEERIRHSQEEIARILPPRAEYVTDTSEFQDVKARLARLENRKKINDEKGTDRPSLRRASSSGSEGQGGQKPSDDAPPTLSRRDGQQMETGDGQSGY